MIDTDYSWQPTGGWNAVGKKLASGVQSFTESWGGMANAEDAQCGRGTQTQTCKRVAEESVHRRLFTDELYPNPLGQFYHKDATAVRAQDGHAGTLAYNNYRYHDKATYINTNLVGQGACVSPRNLLRLGGELVRPRHFHTTLDWYHDTTYTRQSNNIVNGVPFVYPDSHSLNQEFTVWFGKGKDLETNLATWPKTVCSDGGDVCSEGGDAACSDGGELRRTSESVGKNTVLIGADALMQSEEKGRRGDCGSCQVDGRAEGPPALAGGSASKHDGGPRRGERGDAASGCASRGGRGDDML